MNIKTSTLNEIYTISSLIQESITKIKWIEYQDNSFNIFLNRFCWEKKAENNLNHRVNSILHLENVDKIEIKKENKIIDEFKVLLSISEYQNGIQMIFNNNYIIKISGNNINLRLEDVTESWEVQFSHLTI